MHQGLPSWLHLLVHAPAWRLQISLSQPWKTAADYCADIGASAYGPRQAPLALAPAA